MLRIGLCGTGDAAGHHARALATLGTDGTLALSAICARSLASVERFRIDLGLGSSRGPGPSAFDSFEALVRSGTCDGVLLASPDGLHAEQAIAALQSGLHVLVEKPLALSLADGARVCEAASAAGKALMVGYHLRHHQAHVALRNALSERVGDVRHIHVRWAWPDPKTDGWRARGDGARFFAMAALGTHAVDLCHWLTGSRVRELAAMLALEGQTDRAAEVTLAFEQGALAHVSVSVRDRATSRLVVAGPLGELECTGTLGARGTGELGYRSRGTGLLPLPYVPQNPYAMQLRAFVDATRTGSIDRDALENLAVLDQLIPYLSAPILPSFAPRPR